MSANGRLTSAELARVGDGLQLANDTATAWLAMCAAAAKAGVDLWVARPVGAYRSIAVQEGMRATPARYGLNPASVVSVAAPGSSTHGDGTSVDIGSFPPAFDLGRFGDAGRTRRAWVLANASKFGFTRPFSEADPNHFKHNGLTKPSWLQYRLDWDEMASKAEIKQAFREVLSERLITSPVTGNKVSPLAILSALHGNVGEIEETVNDIAEDVAAEEPAAPTGT